MLSKAAPAEHTLLARERPGHRNASSGQTQSARLFLGIMNTNPLIKTLSVQGVGGLHQPCALHMHLVL